MKAQQPNKKYSASISTRSWPRGSQCNRSYQPPQLQGSLMEILARMCSQASQGKLEICSGLKPLSDAPEGAKTLRPIDCKQTVRPAKHGIGSNCISAFICSMRNAEVNHITSTEAKQPFPKWLPSSKKLRATTTSNSVRRPCARLPKSCSNAA